MKTFKVAVFEHARDGGKKPRYMAYTLWYNPAWDGCCMHEVTACSGTEAKGLAIAEHKKNCGPRPPALDPPAPPR